MFRRISVAVLVLAAATSWAAPPTVQELVQQVPPDARSVVAVDAASLRQAPLIQGWLLDHQAEWTGVDDEATRFLRDAGLDPAADIDALVFAVLAGEVGGNGGKDGHPLALFGGRFDAASLTAALVDRGAVAEELAGVTVYRVDAKEDAAHAPLMRITDDLVMLGDHEALTASFGRGGGPVTIVDQEVSAGHLDLGATFWMVSDLPERKPGDLPAVGTDGPEGQAAQAVLAASSMVRRVAGWGSLDEELELHGFATADSEENAGLLRDTLRGALAVARMTAQDKDPRLVEVLRGVSVEADGAVVTVAAAVPVELLQKLAGKPEPRAAKTRRATPR